MSSLLLIGASARAAAMSAARAGFTPRAIDQFADLDLSQLGPTSQLRRYPYEALTLIRNEPDVPWIYTGGLENYPRLIDRLAAERPLLGNPGSVVRHVRDRRAWRTVLDRAGIAIPPESDDPNGVPTDGSWIVKRRRSAGGLHVRRWTRSMAERGLPRGWYLQQIVEGVQLGATFIGERDRALFLGATYSLVTSNVPRTRCSGSSRIRQSSGGIPVTIPPNSGEFGYAEIADLDVSSLPWLYGGSLGPVPLAESVQQQLAHLGDLLTHEFRLRGLFGIDVILVGEQIYALELNPRYTANVECLELATGLNSLPLHIAACGGESLSVRMPYGSSLVGKQIVYARQAVPIEQQHVDAWLAENTDPLRPLIADIPRVGTTIAPGQPIATVFATGSTIDETRLALEQRADQFLSTLN